jgi:predicted murein hydrolase (TIGR00659 family)
MKELLTESVYFGMVLTLVSYEIGLAVKRRVKFPLANPLLVGAALIILVLLALGIEYETYQASVRPISFLLTPATVCLAIPLYRQLSLLKKYPLAIFGGVLSGVLTAMVSIYLLSLAFGLTHEEYVSILPKSITTAIGIGLSQELDGYVAITVSAIMITGLFGNIAGGLLCRILGIKDPIAKGIAIGTASHVMGTAKAMELGKVEGAMSSLSVAVAGAMTVGAAILFQGLI